MIINLNGKIKVKLTDKGKDIYYHQNDGFYSTVKPHMPYVEEEGYTSFQLWEFMQIYGEHIKMGFDLPCETNIIYEGVN